MLYSLIRKYDFNFLFFISFAFHLFLVPTFTLTAMSNRLFASYCSWKQKSEIAFVSEFGDCEPVEPRLPHVPGAFALSVITHVPLVAVTPHRRTLDDIEKNEKKKKKITQ